MATIVPVVEGDGEISAVPELLRRMLYHHSAENTAGYAVRIDRPIRQPRSRLIKEEEFKKTMGVARKQPDCSAILVLFDADKGGCPAQLGPQGVRWAQEQIGNFPVYVVVARHEYEAWLIASIETLHGKREIQSGAAPPPDVEAIRDAKGWLEKHMPAGRKYSETSDQVALTTFLDFNLAYERSDSFRKLWKDFSAIVSHLIGSTVKLNAENAPHGN